MRFSVRTMCAALKSLSASAALAVAALAMTNGNLSQAANKLFGKDAQAREVMAHLKRDIADYLRFHLLAVAAGQAEEVLKALSAWLGDTLSVDDKGQPVWGGIAGEFQIPGHPIHSNRYPANDPTLVAPMLGEHNREVLM
ncbi:MAG: hypothetical protein RI963_3609, partial [Planctomycetota bacterium]